MSRNLDQFLNEAATQSLGLSAALESLVDRELEARNARSIERRFRLAHLGVRYSIDNFQFNPATLTVPVGTTVTWTNHDKDEHTVTSSTRLFSSAGLDPNETYSFRFDTPGTYAYFCALHPHMTAQIVVQ